MRIPPMLWDCSPHGVRPGRTAGLSTPGTCGSSDGQSAPRGVSSTEQSSIGRDLEQRGLRMVPSTDLESASCSWLGVPHTQPLFVISSVETITVLQVTSEQRQEGPG